MTTFNLPRKSPVQMAYICNDVKASVRRHHEQFGSGPFFIAENISDTSSIYRGVDTKHLFSAAYGQWGNVMVEFIQQHSPGLSVYNERFPDGREGLHHVAMIVDNLDDEVRRMNEAGIETACLAQAGPEISIAMMDATHLLGHYLELLEPVPGVLNNYRHVREASVDFNGENLIRPITLF